jgi:hypothetical protein
MHRTNIRRLARASALAATLALPAAAQAATPPGATTGGAANITFSAARLTGSVDPNGAQTTYQFQYGTTNAYGSVTPAATVAGNARKAVTADLSLLAPVTTYHYRLVASNVKGQTVGRDRTFRTRRQPLGVTFAATPNPILTAGFTTLSGQLTGTGSSGRPIALESNPFPYTQGFKQEGNAVVTDAAGNYSFGPTLVALNTQYRVRLPDAPSVVSPIVVVSVQPRVSTHIATTRVRRGGRLTFSGTIRPAMDGTAVAIQKLGSKGRWVTIAGTVARHGNSGESMYSKKVTIRRGGTYRVYAGVANGQFVPNTGRVIHIHTR